MNEDNEFEDHDEVDEKTQRKMRIEDMRRKIQERHKFEDDEMDTLFRTDDAVEAFYNDLKKLDESENEGEPVDDDDEWIDDNIELTPTQKAEVERHNKDKAERERAKKEIKHQKAKKDFESDAPPGLKYEDFVKSIEEGLAEEGITFDD